MPMGTAGIAPLELSGLIGGSLGYYSTQLSGSITAQLVTFILLEEAITVLITLFKNYYSTHMLLKSNKNIIV